MMERVFIDTSALIAFFDKSDNLHPKAVRLFDKIREKRIRIIVTDYILSEVITTVMARAGHQMAVRAGEFIFNSRVVNIVWLDKSLKLKAWEYFKKHSDKNYSFTDCTSFVLMKEVKAVHFFAFDDDFSRAGFIDFSNMLNADES